MRVCHPRACAAIEGFKSFRTRTEVTLLNGFNVITGANGAGKSSFIDAISFALTETKPNRLRVRPLPPVQIRFNGARTRKTTPAHVTCARITIARWMSKLARDALPTHRYPTSLTSSARRRTWCARSTSPEHGLFGRWSDLQRARPRA